MAASALSSTSAAGYSLRDAKSSDQQAIMDIVNDAYSVESDESSGVAFKTGPRFTALDEPAVFVNDGRCIVAEDSDGAILGTICYDLNYHGDTSQGEFGPLAVR